MDTLEFFKKGHNSGTPGVTLIQTGSCTSTLHWDHV